jgi:putative choline sulfate-utilization transcription factor
MSEQSVDLAWMRLLVEVGKKGSLSAAAEALGLSQPAVSYQIRLLEQSFGLPLLQRLHRGVRFTDEGQRLLAIAERTVSDIDGLQRSLRAAHRRPTVRLATDYAFSSLWLIPRMHAFRQRYPDIDLQIVATQRLGHHWREDADLAVAFGPASEFGKGAILLMPERVVPVCTPGQVRRLPAPSVSSVEQEPLIHLEAESISPWLDWQTYLARLGQAENGQERPGDLRFNTYALVVQAAMAGQGVALGWLGLVDHLLEANLLVVAGEMVSVPERGYWLVSGSKSDAVAHLASWLVHEAAITGSDRLAD